MAGIIRAAAGNAEAQKAFQSQLDGVNNRIQTINNTLTVFANEGLLDLRQGVLGDLTDAKISLQSPPTVYQDLVITGSANGEGAPTVGAYGDIRAWDARTGKLVWTFHTVPRPGEPGHETWPPEASRL